METLKYGELLTITKKLCETFYVSETRMFGPAVKTMSDEKNVIYSILKMSIDTARYQYDPRDLKRAVMICVEEANLSVENKSIGVLPTTLPPKDNA